MQLSKGQKEIPKDKYPLKIENIEDWNDELLKEEVGNYNKNELPK